MSARDKIAGMFPQRQLGEQAADEILAQHAHELAEQIREDSRSTLVQQGGKFHAGMNHAADLIDPKEQR